MGSGFSKIKKQAKQFEEQFSKMQEQMEQMEFEGTSGNGLVKIVLSGDRKMKSITINPDCVDPEDIEGLQDLIQAAYEQAREKAASNDPMTQMSNQLGGALPF